MSYFTINNVMKRKDYFNNTIRYEIFENLGFQIWRQGLGVIVKVNNLIIQKLA